MNLNYEQEKKLFVERVTDIMMMNIATDGAYSHLLQKEVYYGNHRFDVQELETLLREALLKVSKRQQKASI